MQFGGRFCSGTNFLLRMAPSTDFAIESVLQTALLLPLLLVRVVATVPQHPFAT